MQLQNDGQSFPYQVAEFYLVVGEFQSSHKSISSPLNIYIIYRF